jgi:hypothetical protein
MKGGEHMKTIVIREDALQAIKDRATFPFQQQREAGEIVVFGKKVKLFFIDIDVDIESHIRSKGVDVDDVDQVSDFIISALTLQH